MLGTLSADDVMRLPHALFTSTLAFVSERIYVALVEDQAATREGLTLLINILFSLSVRGISLGGHLGGLAGGMITAWLIIQLGERRRLQPLALATCAAVGVAAFVGAIAVAGGHGLAPNGVGFSS